MLNQFRITARHSPRTPVRKGLSQTPSGCPQPARSGPGEDGPESFHDPSGRFFGMEDGIRHREKEGPGEPGPAERLSDTRKLIDVITPELFFPLKKAAGQHA